MTANSTARYEKALKRNLGEIGQAILERTALIALEDVDSAHAWDFFRISSFAQFNDIVSHTIKVFEDSSGAASFWYIERSDKAAMGRAAKVAGVKIEEIKTLCEGFEHIRNKTHFHIDKGAVLTPMKVWEDAGVTGDELGRLLDSALRVLIHLYKAKTGNDYELPDYDGSDVGKIIRSYVKDNPDGNVLI